jgi:hypothetical protein
MKMQELEKIEITEGLQLKILNDTGEDLVLQAQHLEKGMFKKGHQAPDIIESYEQKEIHLVACEGSCEGGSDVEGWIKYGIGCAEGYCKLHFKYLGKENRVTYSCECHMHDGKMLCETSRDQKNGRVVSWIIGPKA